MPAVCRTPRTGSTALTTFIGTDGKPTWEAVALFLQRNKHRLDPRHHEFIDDMAARTAWGRRADRASAQVSAQPVLQARRKDHMSVQVDEATVRQFVEIITPMPRRSSTAPARRRVAAVPHPSRRESIVLSRFRYRRRRPHGRRLRSPTPAPAQRLRRRPHRARDLRGNKRGGLEDTPWVFGLVADCDADKGKGGNITARPRLAIETSPGNLHLWFLLDPCHHGRTGEADRRRHPGELRRRPGHRRRHAVLPRGRYAELSLRGQARARAYHDRADPDLRASRPAVGARRAARHVRCARIGIPGCPRARPPVVRRSDASGRPARRHPPGAAPARTAPTVSQGGSAARAATLDH